MSDRKIVFIDIDGTLRDLDGYIPDSAVKAVREARERGHEVWVCSGRPFFQIQEDVLRIGFDGIIASSGGYVTYRGRCIRHNAFERKELSCLIDYLHRQDSAVELHWYRGRYMMETDRPHYRQIQDHIEKLYGPDGRALVETPIWLPSEKELEGAEKILYFSRKLPKEQVRADWPDMAVVDLSIPSPDPYGGEITPKTTTKAEGIRSALKAGGFSRQDVIAVGDSENDLSMLGIAETAVAMGNGTEAVRAAADLVTDSVRDDGLWKAFRVLGLI